MLKNSSHVLFLFIPMLTWWSSSNAACPTQTGVTFTKDGCCTDNVCTAGCTEVVVACADGYIGTDFNSNCTADSSWSDDVTAICSKVCPAPTGSTVTADCCSSSVCVIGCNNVVISCVFTSNGSDVTANCQADGTWSVANVDNTCTADCPTQDGVTFTNPTCCSANSCDVGCNGVQVICTDGYSGIPTVADCGFNGEWSKTVTDICTKDCPTQDGVTFTNPTCCSANSCDVGCNGVQVTCTDGYSGIPTVADCGSNGEWSKTVTDICTKEKSTLTTAPNAAADVTSGASDAYEDHSKWTKNIVLFGYLVVSSLTMLIF